jgi:hypothetical protein
MVHVGKTPWAGFAPVTFNIVKDLVSAGDFVGFGIGDDTHNVSMKAGVVKTAGFAYAGLWLNQATPTVSNYAFLDGGAGYNVFNSAATKIDFRIANDQIMGIYASHGMSLGHTLNTTDPGSNSFLCEGSITTQNTTHEDADGGRESNWNFKGEQSGGEISTLARIQAQHDGAADDQKGELLFYTNDGSDNDTPTEALRLDSSQLATLAVGAMFNNSVDSASVANQVTIGGYEIAAGQRSLAISQENAVVVEVDETKFSHKLPVRINGATYYIMLTAT